MKIMILIMILFFGIQTSGLGQHAKEGAVVSKVEYNKLAVSELRQTYSSEVQKILSELDSLLNLDPTIEFRTVGEASRISNKFSLYAQLLKAATEKELLDILANQKEVAPIRGYAYMAYAFKCDVEKRKEKILNYSFKLNTLKGCIGYNDMAFAEFKKYVRKRNGYDPNPKNTIIDPEEKQVIKEENKIRKEQGINERKDFSVSCDDSLDFDTATVGKTIIRYKLISSHSYLIEGTTTIIGEIILPDYNSESDKSTLFSFLNSLNGSNKIDRFIAFQTCTARFIYSSSYPPGSKERKAIEKQVIGKFNLKDQK